MPSASVLDALAQTLKLTDAERAHMHRLAGRAVPEIVVLEDPAPSLAFLLNRLGDTPAQIVSDLGSILAQNDAADVLFPWVVEEGTQGANVYEHWFCHDEVRAEFPEQRRSSYSDEQAGEIRAAATRRYLAGDNRGYELVAMLSKRSAEFRNAWESQLVHDGRDKQIWVPAAHGAVLDAHVTVDEHSSQRLMAFERIERADFSNLE